MSPLVLAAVWCAAGAVALPVARRVRPRRALAAVPLGLGLLSALAASVDDWPGPVAATSYGATLALGRPGLGLVVAGGIAVAVTLLLDPGLEGGEVPSACLVGAACVVILSATVPAVWAVAVSIGGGVLAVRWISSEPGRGTLAMGRGIGMGAAALLAAAALLPESLGRVDSRTAVAGALMAIGVAAFLALLPIGGWAGAVVTVVRGGDLAPWTLLLAPAVLLSAGAALPALPLATRDAFSTDVLALGLATAIWGGMQALRSAPRSRYGRLWVADIALAAAGLGSLHDAGRLGGLLLVLTHLGAGALLLHPPRPGTERPHRVTWLALAGLPPAPAFWGRLLVLEGLAQTSGVALVLGLAAMALTTATAIRALVASDAPPEGRAAGPAIRVLAWGTCVATLALGFAPGVIGERLYGVAFG